MIEPKEGKMHNALTRAPGEVLPHVRRECRNKRPVLCLTPVREHERHSVYDETPQRDGPDIFAIGCTVSLICTALH